MRTYCSPLSPLHKKWTLDSTITPYHLEVTNLGLLYASFRYPESCRTPCSSLHPTQN